MIGACLVNEVIIRVGNSAFDKYTPPDDRSQVIINLPLIPSLPNQIRQFLVHQDGFDIEFGEQAEVMEMLGGMPLSW